MSAFQKGLITGIGIFLLLALCVGVAVGVWWLNSSHALSGLTTFNSPFAQPSATPLANSLPDSSNSNTDPNSNANPSGTPAAPGGVRAQLAGSFGLVQAVNGDSLTVSNPRGTETITVGNDTRIVYTGNPGATLNDIQSGDKVLAIGGGRNGSAMDARLLVVAPASYTSANILAGQITSVQGNSFVVKTLQGTKTVTTNAATQLFGAQLNSNANATLTVGLNVLVIGQPDANGLTAELVLAQARRAAGGTNLNPRLRPTPTPTN